MVKEIQICPNCGNYVQANRVKSYSNKVTRQGAKSAVHMATSAGGMSTGAAIGSAFGPVGTVVGGAIGFIGSAMFNQKVNEGIDGVADIFTDFDLEYKCPKCGHSWTPGNEGNVFDCDDDEEYSDDEEHEYEVDDEDFEYLYEQFRFFVDTYLETEEFLDFDDFKRYISEVENFRRNNCEEPSYFWGKFAYLIAVAKCEYFIKEVYVKDHSSIGIQSLYDYCIAPSRNEIRYVRDEIDEDDKGYLIISATMYMLEMFWRDDENELFFYDDVRESVERDTDNFQNYSDVVFNEEWVKQMFYYVYKQMVDCLGEVKLEKPDNFELEYENELKNLLEDYGEIGSKERNGLERLRIKLKISEEKAREIERNLICDSLCTMTESEKEYLDEYKSMLEDYGEIGTIERKRLDRIREKLNITSERANAIENSLNSVPLTENESFYLDAYKELLEDYGQIGENERKRLNRLREKYGISEARAFEIENINR